MGGIETLAKTIGADPLARLPWENKRQREGLAPLAATAPHVLGVDLDDLAAAAPREAERLDMRYRWIGRILGNDLIEVDEAMAPFGREVLAGSGAGGRTLVAMIDQNKANDAHRMIMVSLRVGERALPLAWRMKKTQGAIGFRERKEALEAVVAPPPEGARATSMGDRFYGSPALISWCREQGWGWRPRCKQDLLVFDRNGGETTLKECFRARRAYVERHRTDREARPRQYRHAARRRASRTMDRRPVRSPDAMARARLRPALGHRGDVLGLQNARLQSGRQPDRTRRQTRPARSRAEHRALLGGVHRHVGRPRKQNPRRKKAPKARRKNVARELISLFERGPRRIQFRFQRPAAPPPRRRYGPLGKLMGGKRMARAIG